MTLSLPPILSLKPFGAQILKEKLHIINHISCNPQTSLSLTTPHRKHNVASPAHTETPPRMFSYSDLLRRLEITPQMGVLEKWASKYPSIFRYTSSANSNRIPHVSLFTGHVSHHALPIHRHCLQPCCNQRQNGSFRREYRGIVNAWKTSLPGQCMTM
jgi:hypothetical protein